MESPIQSLWVGDRLSAMEHMAIASFLRHGHIFHLYVYQHPTGIPEGTIVRDANEILPAARIFKYREHDTYAGFSNFFRYKLLLERGGWWVDTDMICLKPFRFPSEYVFSSEMEAGRPTINNGAMKAPPGSPIFQYAWQLCEMFDPRKLKWGQSGPALMSRCVEKFGLQRFVQPPEVFCPVDGPDWQRILEPSMRPRFGAQTHAVHLWNELWRRAKRDKNARYHPESLYETLKGSYLDPGVAFRPKRRWLWAPWGG
jgi:alpha 1,4-glycosyltransferase/glycosyl transferase-like sugar-binding protein